jgi:hypothetical protein
MFLTDLYMISLKLINKFQSFILLKPDGYFMYHLVEH